MEFRGSVSPAEEVSGCHASTSSKNQQAEFKITLHSHITLDTNNNTELPFNFWISVYVEYVFIIYIINFYNYRNLYGYLYL